MEAENADTDFQLIGFPHIVDQNGLRSREPFEVLASQFVDELREGEKPSIELYARRFPPHAERIREFFPVLKLLEQARIEKESSTFRHNMPERFPFSTLANCELLCELGRGGMGVVFQARDISSRHIVAIKVLPWRVTIVPEWQQRFEREAQTAALLRHRNIVPVFRFGLEHGYCYYVMQFVNGIGLDRIIDRLQDAEGVIYHEEIRQLEETRPDGFVPLQAGVESGGSILKASAFEMEGTKRQRLTRTTWASFARIAIQAAQALHSAHEAGILHNDIKPGNLLLDIEGRVWVTDFGLSQVMNNARGLFGHRSQSPGAPTAFRGNPQSGMQNPSPIPHIAGTLRYMAPERLLAEITDARSDIYSLGVTLYELILQRPAFEQTDRELLIRAILDDTPPAPRAVNREVPRDLETIILNCMARDRDKRYPSASNLLTDLLKFCSGDRVFSTRPGVVVDFLRSWKRKIQDPQG